MYTNKSYSRPCLAFSSLEDLYSKFTVLTVAALVLLSTLSSAQVIPSSRGLQKQTLPSDTSPSSNALKEYVIYSVVEGSFQDSDNEKIRLHLGMILGPADVQEYGGEYTGVDFWRVKMSDMQRTAFVSANPRVCSTSMKKITLIKCLD